MNEVMVIRHKAKDLTVGAVEAPSVMTSDELLHLWLMRQGLTDASAWQYETHRSPVVPWESLRKVDQPFDHGS